MLFADSEIRLILPMLSVANDMESFCAIFTDPAVVAAELNSAYTFCAQRTCMSTRKYPSCGDIEENTADFCASERMSESFCEAVVIVTSIMRC